MTLTVNSLCTGYGGLEMAAARVLDLELSWYAEIDPGACAVLERHHPGVPNLGDIEAADFSAAPGADVLTAGFPCTDISDAGPRTGIAGKRSGIWKDVARCIGVQRPSLVLLENVGALRTRGLDRVLTDLAAHGYGLRWTTVHASDIGAPHPRRRWFGAAVPLSEGPLPLLLPASLPFHGAFDLDGLRAVGAPPRLAVGVFLKTPTANLGGNGGPQDPRKRRAGGHGPTLEDEVAHLLPSPTSADGTGGPGRSPRRTGGDNLRTAVVDPGTELSWVCTDGRDFGPAVRHWEAVLGRPAGRPVVPGTRSLCPVFTEWLMGIPAGHVTDTHTQALTRRQMLVVLGNGIVPQQGAYAYRRLLDAWEWTKDRHGEHPQ